MEVELQDINFYAAFSVGVETDAEGTASFAAGSGSTSSVVDVNAIGALAIPCDR